MDEWMKFVWQICNKQMLILDSDNMNTHKMQLMILFINTPSCVEKYLPPLVKSYINCD